jgi:hypothetical protein
MMSVKTNNILRAVSLMILFVGLKGSATSKDASAQWSDLVRFETCSLASSDEQVVAGADFRWGQPLDELNERGERLYHTGKRLPKRAYWDEEQIVVPIHTIRGEQIVRLKPSFILSVRRHIEEGLRRGYVDQVIFSDMGHSHFFIPSDYYRDHLAPFTVAQRHLMYEKMLAYPGLKVLYHTAEQLLMLSPDQTLKDDRHLQWRFYTRNLVGDNRGRGQMEIIHQADHSYNTGRDYEEGYRYWGAGFYITANSEGCFSYRFQGETRYFDLNLEGIDFSRGKGL